jgi:dTDP-4-dehydrorhamnose reductase
LKQSLTIAVSGSNGQLGSELRELAKQFPSHRFYFFDRQAFSITDEAAAASVFETHQPDFFINCAAYTAVDKAESEKELAFQINGQAPGTLASLCKQYHCRFLHISTDYVFDGTAREPIKEADTVSPVNSYGESKLRGEQLAMKNNEEALIIRTSWVYSVYGNNFVKTMMRLMKEREEIRVVSDQIGSPTYAADLAEAILQIVVSGKWVPGIYNYSNEGILSWFEFANEIKKQTGSSCMVTPIATAQYPTPARRPAYSVLDKEKIVSTYGVVLRHWQESLERCIQKLSA